MVFLPFCFGFSLVTFLRFVSLQYENHPIPPFQNKSPNIWYRIDSQATGIATSSSWYILWLKIFTGISVTCNLADISSYVSIIQAHKHMRPIIVYLLNEQNNTTSSDWSMFARKKNNIRWYSNTISSSTTAEYGYSFIVPSGNSRCKQLLKLVSSYFWNLWLWHFTFHRN